MSSNASDKTHRRPHGPIRRILVIKNRAIGDTILLTGVLRLLKRHFPNHQIHALVRSPAGELLEGLPFIDRVISVNEPRNKLERTGYWFKMVKRLREKRYDYVLNFHASFRTALTAKMLRAVRCVANHHKLKGRNWFSDLPVSGRGQVKPNIERDLDVLRALGIQARLEEAMPEVALYPAEKIAAEKLFSEGPVEAGAGPRIFLGIGASRETKRWPPGHFVALAKKLVETHDARFVISTIASDRQWLDQFFALVQKEPVLENRIRHFSSTSVRQVALLLSQCVAYVGNDSGMKHLAIAMGLKSFTFFGPEAPLEWHPYDRALHPIAYIDALECRTATGKHWCSVAVCDFHRHRCMQELGPETIWSEVARLVDLAKQK